MSESNLLEAARRFVALWDHPAREPGLAPWHAAVDYAYEELKKSVAACAPDEQGATKTAWDLDEMLARIEAAVAEGRLLSKDSVAFLEEMVRQKAAKERPEVLDGESVKLKFPTIKSSASMEVTYRWRPDGETQFVTKTVVLENNPGLVHAITVDFTPRTEGDQT